MAVVHPMLALWGGVRCCVPQLSILPKASMSADQYESLRRIVLWTCRDHGPQRLLVSGEPRPVCAECDQPMLTVPYLRERDTFEMKDALYRIGYRGADPVTTAKIGLGDL